VGSSQRQSTRSERSEPGGIPETQVAWYHPREEVSGWASCEGLKERIGDSVPGGSRKYHTLSYILPMLVIVLLFKYPPLLLISLQRALGSR
jgi:hypothetical protein